MGCITLDPQSGPEEPFRLRDDAAHAERREGSMVD
jgi:hypothetical protein